MKLAILSFATLTSVASAHCNLRSVVGRLLGTSSTDSAHIRVAIHGIASETSPEDLGIIAETVVAAYNTAYETAGYSMSSFHVRSSASVPPLNNAEVQQGQLILADVEAAWHHHCCFCPPGHDEDLNLVDIHGTFEDMFCESLRKSNSANLHEARDCRLAFLDMPGLADENLPIEQVTSNDNKQETEAQVVLHGTVRDLTPQEHVILDESIVAAYNGAFDTAGFALESFESLVEIEMPTGWVPDCHFCAPTQDARLGDSVKLVTARATPLGWSPSCRMCNGDGVTAADLSFPEFAFLHETFEKSLCTKLQQSDSDNFSNVHDCSFRFVYYPTSYPGTQE